MSEQAINPDALEKAKRLQAHPAYLDESHPRHEEVVSTVKRCYGKAYGDQEGKLGSWDKELIQDAERAMSHPAYRDDSHPQHLEAVRVAKQLFVSVYGSDREIESELEKPVSAQERVLSRGV